MAVINTNISSITARNNLMRSEGDLQTSLQRLSSGLRINSAKDDAAGLAITDRMTSQIRGLNQAMRNANDGISLAQTAEGAMSEASNILQRMRELAIQSANATNSASDRAALQAEVSQLQSELTRVSTSTTFNGLKILDGSYTSQSFQIGANANETIDVSIRGAGAGDLQRYAVNAINTTVSQGTGGSAAAAATAAANNVIATQTVTIGGLEGTKTVSVTSGDTAETIANNINKVTGDTGVTALATNITTMSSFTAGTATLSLGNGGSLATVNATISVTDVSALAEEINKVVGTTGITATSDGGTLTLTQAEGKDIVLEGYNTTATTKTVLVKGGNGTETTGVTLTGGGNDSTRVAGYVEFASSAQFSVSSSVANSAGSIVNGAANAITNGTAASVASIDIGTAAGSNTAIKILDIALSTVSSQRAGLGAIQNRLESTIANLASISENVSAARSRIQDADFAAETANLTRAQILQQAGTAMLAQANTLPQSVLSLLQ